MKCGAVGRLAQSLDDKKLLTCRGSGAQSMPVRYRFDSNIVVIEMVGEYSMDELRTSILKSLADSDFPSNSVVLFDLTESRSIYIRSSDDIKNMVQSIAPLAKRFNNRVALVASADLPYGLMRMGSVFSEAGSICLRSRSRNAASAAG